MRYEKGHKEETRRRIVDVASQRFRKDGIAATGLAGLMADAGLTHGGFYAHFPSKNDLVRDALAASLVRTKDLLSAEPAGNVVKTDWKQSCNAIFARRTATGSKRVARSRLLRPRFPDVMQKHAISCPQRSAMSCRSLRPSCPLSSRSKTRWTLPTRSTVL